MDNAPGRDCLCRKAFLMTTIIELVVSLMAILGAAPSCSPMPLRCSVSGWTWAQELGGERARSGGDRFTGDHDPGGRPYRAPLTGESAGGAGEIGVGAILGAPSCSPRSPVRRRDLDPDLQAPQGATTTS